MILIILAPKAGHRARERQRFKRIQAAEALAPGENTCTWEKILAPGENTCAWEKTLALGKTLAPGATGKKYLQQGETVGQGK